MSIYSGEQVTVAEELPAVSVENVSHHTQGVIRSYINYRLSHDHVQPLDNNFADADEDQDDQLSEQHTGQQLATVAEQLERRNGRDLERLIQRMLDLTGPCASNDDWFEAFRLVVDSVFTGEFSWTKLIVVLSFGYRLLQKVWQSGWRPAFGIVSGVIARYFLQENVLRWLARHGGWLAANCLRITRTMDLQTNIAVGVGTGIAAAFLSFSVIYFVRRHALGSP